MYYWITYWSHCRHILQYSNWYQTIFSLAVLAAILLGFGKSLGRDHRLAVNLFYTGPIFFVCIGALLSSGKIGILLVTVGTAISR